MKNIVILISGGGSNMLAIAKTAKRDDWAGKFGARVACVISNRADARGLQLARDMGITTDVVDHKAYPSREAFDAEIGAAHCAV
jgi:phosphoribosylglycinamide formyltransferase-1